MGFAFLFLPPKDFSIIPTINIKYQHKKHPLKKKEGFEERDLKLKMA
jgi:hypothetical protein